MSNDGRPASADHLDLVRTLADLAREFGNSRQVRTTDDVLDSVLSVSIELVEPADHASVGSVGGAATSATGFPRRATSDVASTLDDVQVSAGVGPSVEVLSTVDGEPTALAGSVERWPALAETATASGVRSIAAVPMFTKERTLGVLTLYSVTESAFDDEDLTVASAVAAHAAIALQGVQKEAQFRSGLASRDIIGQAKGMLMERFEVDSVQAFEMLSRLSQDNNRPLHLLAADIVEAGAKLRQESS